MLRIGSALNGYTIVASDGEIGTVSDFLFDDRTWRLRWLVVDAGTWLTGRQVLVHPSAIGTPDDALRELPVTLTKKQVEESPDIRQDQPVSRPIESNLYNYYGWDPLWGGGGYFGASPNAIASPFSAPSAFGGMIEDEVIDERDPHLRSLAAVTGYYMHATDGRIGHLENFLIDDSAWDIRYLIIDTKNWWPGRHVLLSPHGVLEITAPEQEIRLNVTCDQIKSSPAWTPTDVIDQAYESRLHSHYGWSGYGW